jgi:hypothetical protein
LVDLLETNKRAEERHNALQARKGFLEERLRKAQFARESIKTITTLKGTKTVPNEDYLTKEQKQNMQAELGQLLDSNPNASGSIAQAEQVKNQINTDYQKEHRRNESLHEKYNKNREEIQTLRGIKTTEGSLAYFDEMVRVAEEEIRTKKTERDGKKKALRAKEEERDRLLTQLGLEVGSIPSETTLTQRVIQQTHQKLEELTAEITKLRTEEGKPKKVASDEDIERADAIDLAKRAVTDTTLNRIYEAIRNDEISLADIAETASDKGFRIIIEQLFGSEALVEGGEGKYDIARRLIPKRILAEAIIKVYGIELADGTDVNDELYDGRLARYLSHDKIRTIAVFRKVIDNLYERCRRYNPFGEVIE